MIKGKYSLVFWLCTLALVKTSCDRNDGDKVSESAPVVLPEPIKVLRSGLGFSTKTFEVSVDFATGEVQYRQQWDRDATCSGDFKLESELSSWKDVSDQIAVCSSENKRPISDGFLNIIKLYYTSTTQLPLGLNVTEDQGLKVVEFQESYNEFIGGKQQFLCKGSFELDELIEKKADCLSLDE